MEKQLSFYEFTQLPQLEQYDLVFTQGEFIDTLEKADVKFSLYKLFSFYVEVVYDFTGNKIVSLTSFLKTN